jgi:hypothetical protein
MTANPPAKTPAAPTAILHPPVKTPLDPAFDDWLALLSVATSELWLGALFEDPETRLLAVKNEGVDPTTGSYSLDGLESSS